MKSFSAVIVGLVASLLFEGLRAAPAAPSSVQSLMLVEETGRFLALSRHGVVSANGEMGK